jgi:site-specific DNA-methyltransferase (adenine-specific)
MPILNKIYQGDALEVLKSWPDEFADCVITSPPYNKHSAKRKGHITDSWKKAGIGYGDFNDDMPETKYQAWQKEIIKECLRVLKKGGSIFYNHKPRIVNHKIIFPQEWLSDFIIRQMIIWDRGSSPALEPIRFMPSTEYIFWITKEAKTPIFNSDMFNLKEVWRINPAKNNEHPAPFPEELVARCINSCSKKNDLILDPFMGSGTTAYVARFLGRNYLGIELLGDYIKLAEKRLAQQVLL